MTEFNLSEKIGIPKLAVIPVKDVKEFIRLLKEGLAQKIIDKNLADLDMIEILVIIDKLAGEKLK